MKCVLLVRVSTDKQSLDEQELDLYNKAIEDGFSEEDIHVIAYVESAIKLSEEKRLGLIDLKNYIQSNNDVECVYAWEISRIGRTKKVLFSILDYLVSRKIQLRIISPDIKLLKNDKSIDEAAETLFTLFAQLSESEMRNKINRFKRGKKENARNGIYNGGNIAFGYKVNKENNGKIEIDENNGEIVKTIFRLYLCGYSQPKIARQLEKMGIFNIKISLINHILNNEYYTGKLIKKQYNERVYPVLISTETFAKCREIAKKNNTSISKTRNIYYGEGLMRCASCGAKWSATGSKVAYHCSNAYKAKTLYKYEYTTKEQCKDMTSISVNIIDSLLWELAINEEANTVFRNNGQRIEELKIKIKDKEIEKNNINKLIENKYSILKRIVNVYIDGNLSKELYEEKSREINQEINSYKSELIELDGLIENYNSLINELQENTYISKIFNNRNEYKERLKLIESDKERYDLIHKHILRVSVEKIEPIMYEFSNGTKLAQTKKIEVLTKKQDIEERPPYVFYFIPFDGKGGTILKVHTDMDGEIYYDKFIFKYLSRFVDKAKIKLREKAKKNKEKQK